MKSLVLCCMVIWLCMVNAQSCSDDFLVTKDGTSYLRVTSSSELFACSPEINICEAIMSMSEPSDIWSTTDDGVDVFRTDKGSLLLHVDPDVFFERGLEYLPSEASVAGLKMFFFAGKAAFRVGNFLTNWTDYDIGLGSVAFGYNTSSPGDGSLAAGYGNGRLESSGTGSFAMGLADEGTILSDSWGSVALGYAYYGNIIAESYGSIAYGYTDEGEIFSSNYGSVAFGSALTGSITAHGVGAIAFGHASYGDIIAEKEGSIAFGYAYYGNITAEYYGSTAFGNAYEGDVIANGYGAVAFGIGYLASIRAEEDGSIAFGYAWGGDVVAESEGSIAFGLAYYGDIRSVHYGSIAGGYAHSGNITASGEGSVALGLAGDSSTLEAKGDGSVALGINSVAEFDGQTTIGICNILMEQELAAVDPPTSEKPLFVVGNGDVSDVWTECSTRFTALVLTNSGDLHITGNIYFHDADTVPADLHTAGVQCEGPTCSPPPPGKRNGLSNDYELKYNELQNNLMKANQEIDSLKQELMNDKMEIEILKQQMQQLLQNLKNH